MLPLRINPTFLLPSNQFKEGGWYLKDDWFYAGCDWNMDSSEGSHIPSATLDYHNGEGEYKPIFEWIFSDGIDNILPVYSSC